MRILAIIAVLLVLPSVMAFSVTAPDTTFTVNTRTTQQIDITVFSDKADSVTVNFIDSKPWVTLSASQLQFTQQEKTKTLSVFVSPIDNTLEGLYKLSILFESLTTNELKKADLFVYVQKGEIVYLEKIVVTGSLQPLGSAKVSFYVTNLKTTTVQNVQLEGTISTPTSEFIAIDRVIPRIDPGESQVVDMPISFENNVEPGTYSIDARVRYQGESTNAKQTFTVDRKPVMKTMEQKNSQLFGYSRTFTVTNEGTTTGDYTFYGEVSGFDQNFYKGDEPLFIQGSQYVWTETGIAPGETRTVTYSIEYTPMFAFIFALILVVWLYFTRFRAVQIRKYIIQKKSIVEGDEFTVAVEIHNSTGRMVDAEITDFVPAVFNMKDSESGPRATKKKGQVGAELTWHAKNLAPRESRIFTYKVIPVFGVRGLIKLPKATVIYKYFGRTMETHSGSTALGVSEINNEDQLWKRFFAKE